MSKGIKVTTKSGDEIQCTWLENPETKWLESEWNELEKRSECSVFLTWLWIGTWLECFVGDFVVIVAKKHGITVGLAIMICKKSRRLSCPKVDYFLHRSGNEKEDQIWIEYNDFLLYKDHSNLTRDCMIAFLSERVRKNESLNIGPSLQGRFDYLDKLGFDSRKLWEAPTYKTYLKHAGTTDDDFLATLSRNARYQIKRSIKAYQNIGDIRIDTAKTVGEAKSALDLAGYYHRKRWENSGFDNHYFVDFHTKLVEKGVPLGAVELNVIKAGEELIAVVYNFRYRDVVYFYLSAINYEHKEPHYKPGLLAHYYLITKSIEEGASVYDFLGGKARYKETFSNYSEKLMICQYQRYSILHSVDKNLRKLKYWLSNN